MKPINSIVDILSKDTTSLPQIFNKCKALSIIEQKTRKILGDPLQFHCKVVNYEHNCLILQTKNSSWATKVRFMLPELKKNLIKIKELKDLKNIRCIVNTEAFDTNEKQTTQFNQHYPISTKTIQLLNEYANTIEDRELQSALQKLSETLKNRK